MRMQTPQQRYTRALTRRAALKSTAAAAAALAAGALVPRAARADDDGPGIGPTGGGRVNVMYDEMLSYNELYGNPPLLGRVESWSQRIVTEPNAGEQGIVRYADYSDVLPIYGAVHAVPRYGFPHNDVWFNVGEGYIHSSWVVPCREVYNPVEEIPSDGFFWGEISVPTSWQHWQPGLRTARYYDMAYGAVYKVIDKTQDEDGIWWYRIINDLARDDPWWVQAVHVRRIPRREFLPISQNVPHDQKYIIVNLSNYVLTCYEGERPVFSTRVSTGATFFGEEGEPLEFSTPIGRHWVVGKTASRHMVGGEAANDEYDLPGVPWCTYITGNGVAIHGTYWHNDYGTRRSHGCINVTSDAAKWIYRWVTPFTGYDYNRFWIGRENWDIATRVAVDYFD